MPLRMPNQTIRKSCSVDSPVSAIAEIMVIICASLLGSLLFAWLAYRFIPVHDPVDVVGFPLIAGYSERSEQIFFYVFVLSTGVLGWVGVQCFSRFRFPVSGFVRIVPFLLIWLFFANFEQHAMFAFCTAAGAFWVGAKFSQTRDPNIGVVAFLGFLTVFGTHGGFRWQFLLELVNAPMILGVLLIATFVWFGLRQYLVTGVAFTKSFCSATRIWFREHRAASILILLSAVLAMSSRNLRIIIVVTTVCVFLGASTSNSSSRFRLLYTPQSLFVLALALLELKMIQLLPTWWPSRGGAAVCLSLLHGTSLFLFSTMVGLYANSNVPALRDLYECRLNATGWRKTWLCPVLIISFALLSFCNIWAGICLTAVILSILFRWPISRSRTATGLILGGTLLATFIPPVVVDRSIDPHHDGMILSAIWEFETGRKLFSEVSILRCYHFFVALLSRQLLPPTVAAYHLALQLLGFLAVGGAAALAYAWTRSAAWSVATALLLLSCAQADPFLFTYHSRDGILLWVGAFAIEFLRSKSSMRWLWPLLLGCLSAVAGYDCIAPLVPALALAVMFLPPITRVTSRTSYRLVGRLLTVGWVVTLTIGTPTLLLALWQGYESAIEYWKLFVDNANNLSAFYGRPILPGPSMRLAALGTGVLGAWSIAGIYGWKEMGNRKRVLWMFLLVYVFLLFHRGLGRSSVSHLKCVVLPSCIMISLGLFEVISYFRRRGRRGNLTDRTFVGLALASYLAWLMPFSFSSPLVLRKVNSLPREERFEIVDEIRNFSRGRRLAWGNRLDRFVLENVREDQTLWPVEIGIANYMYQRHNPTRHAIASYMCSPAEQRIAVRSMQKNPPSIVFFEQWKIDRVPFELRYYVISQYLFRNYRPSERVQYWIPNDGSWKGFVEFPEELNLDFQLGHLPITWGQRRSPLLSPRAKMKREVLRWQPAKADVTNTHNGSSRGIRQWNCDTQPFQPLDFNYIHLTCTCTFERQLPSKESQLHLEFAPTGQSFDENNRMIFTAIPDGRQHTYLIPVGCSPAWSWRLNINRLRITGPEGLSISQPDSELWLIDEQRSQGADIETIH